MRERKIRLLLIEDDKIDQMAFKRYVKKKDLPYNYSIAESIAEAKKITKSINFDVIISDYMLGDGTSFELFELYKELPVIVTTGTGNEEVAVKAMKLGACDYLIKDPEGNYLTTLPTTVELALKRKQNEKELHNYQKNLESMVKERTAELQAEIVQRMKIEEALRESEYKLFTHLQNTPIGALSWDLNFKAVEWNPASEDIFGYTKEEALGKHVTDLILPEDMKDLVNDIFQDLIAEKGGTRSTNENITKDGRRIVCDWYNTALKDPDGRVIGLASLVNDITERKQIEEALKESERKFRLLANHTYDWEYWIGSDGKFIYLSPSCERITGYSQEELISDPQLVFKMVRPDYAEKVHRHYFDENNKEAPVFSMEFPIITKNGKDVWLEHNCSPVYDDQGNYVGQRGNNRDITDRKRMEEEKAQLEEQYHQAQKMESVGRLAGGVAHDFNNALSVITGFAEMALDDTDPAGKLHDDLNEILTAARHAADITRQLLAFARKQTIAPKVLDLNENVERMLKMIRRLIGEDIDLAWFPGAILWSVKVDPSQIDQILANLCVNARDAIEGVGKVTIESGNITLAEGYCADHAGFVPGEYVQLSVSDNGCGMDKAILDNIFEPFFTTKDVDKGTGLGLATVYGIVKQNNGFINVYSEPGEGTTIKIYLPRYEDKAVRIQEKSTAQIPSSQGETILVVEDDPAILKIMQKILEGLDYTVLASSAPEKVMDIVKEYTGKINLLITDVIMPKMNGRDLAEQLQTICPDLKCIFMSGYTANAIAHHGVLDKGVNFIQKPFTKRELAETIRKVLGNI